MLPFLLSYSIYILYTVYILTLFHSNILLFFFKYSSSFFLFNDYVSFFFFLSLSCVLNTYYMYVPSSFPFLSNLLFLLSLFLPVSLFFTVSFPCLSSHLFYCCYFLTVCFSLLSHVVFTYSIPLLFPFPFYSTYYIPLFPFFSHSSFIFTYSVTSCFHSLLFPYVSLFFKCSIYLFCSTCMFLLFIFPL